MAERLRKCCGTSVADVVGFETQRGERMGSLESVGNRRRTGIANLAAVQDQGPDLAAVCKRFPNQKSASVAHIVAGQIDFSDGAHPQGLQCSNSGEYCSSAQGA